MLVLKYDAVEAGAPDQYGDVIDRLVTVDGSTLQEFPKARVGFIPPEAALSNALDAWLAKRGPRAEPVVVMAHGYQFDPRDISSASTDPDSPITSIYGLPGKVDHHLSWLPLVGECDQNGGTLAENAIAFCYKSQSGILDYANAGWVSDYQHAVFDQSPLAARALAAILVSIASKAPTVRILAHSMGTRTTSQAIGLAQAQLAPTLDRVVLLDGAEFCVDAAANFANCPFDVFSICNRTDEVLALGGDQMCDPIRANGTAEARTIGYDGLGGNERWLDLQLDNPRLIHWFTDRQAPDGIPYRIDAEAEEKSHPVAGLDHWACFTNDGNRALVRALLLKDAMTVAAMTARGVPGGTNAPLYGKFNGLRIPPTPRTLAARKQRLSPAGLTGGGG